MEKINPDRILSEEERNACKDAFDAFDKFGYGSLDHDEILKVLEELGQKPNKEELFKMISQVDKENKGFIDFKDFLKAMAFWKTLESEKEEDDLVDAFVAMGGNPDKTGTVDAKSLIRTVKNEFEMTIDIERLIMEIDGDKSGKIDYYEFKNLLSN